MLAPTRLISSTLDKFSEACLTCPVFITTPDFLAEHLAQLRATNRLIGEVEAKGRARVVEMNRQVATNLENIITAIQAPGDDTGAEDVDASWQQPPPPRCCPAARSTPASVPNAPWRSSTAMASRRA